MPVHESGLRLATATAVLQSLDNVPVVILDNKAVQVVFSNPAFHELVQEHSQEGFLEYIRDAPSSSTKQPGYVEWQGKRVSVGWEESIEGKPRSLLEATEAESGSKRSYSGSEGKKASRAFGKALCAFHYLF